MKFVIKNNLENPLVLMRRLGYHPVKGGESFVRLLARSAFPRLHIYFKPAKGGLEISLHLDQKRPSYSEHTAHSGDYQGEVLDQEKERILNQLAK